MKRFVKGCVFALLLALPFALAGYAGYWRYSTGKSDHVILDQEAAIWVELYNAKRFAECYARADSSLRAAATEAAYCATLEKLFADNGQLVLGRQTGFYISTHDGVQKATCQWAATGKRGEVELMFLCTKGATWGVTGFILRSGRP